MHQDHRSALEVPANPALVRPELRDGLRVPVERVAHVELLSFTIPGYGLGPGGGRPDRRSPRSVLIGGFQYLSRSRSCPTCVVGCRQILAHARRSRRAVSTWTGRAQREGVSWPPSPR